MLFLYLSALETDEERDKLEYIYTTYKRLFMSIALNILHSQERAEDAVHNTFLSLIERKEKFLSKTPIDLRNWCGLVLRGHCIDVLRRNKHYGGGIPLDSDDTHELADESEPFDLRLTKREDYERLAGCISRLDPLNKQILEMKYVLDMSFDEISRELGMTVAQLNSRLARTRAKIKKLYESEN
jgi:RNA polymerase sigma-70 factor (ECF subfamily)